MRQGLPHSASYHHLHKFQDVGWFLEAAGATSYADLPEEMPDEVERFTVGLGPYKIVEWDTGLEVRLEAYEGYNPNPGYQLLPQALHTQPGSAMAQ